MLRMSVRLSLGVNDGMLTSENISWWSCVDSAGGSVEEAVGVTLVLKSADQILVCYLDCLSIDAKIKTTGQVTDTTIDGAAASIST